MKRINFWLGCTAIACLMMGCADEWLVEDFTSKQEKKETPFVIYANSVTDADTRLAFDEDQLTLLWETGDQLVLMDVNKEIDPIYLTTELEEPSAQAVFKSEGGVPAGTYYVVKMANLICYNYEDYLETDISDGTDESCLHYDYALSDLSKIAENLRMYAGPVTIEDGQTSLEVDLKHGMTMLKFTISGSENQLRNSYIGVMSPQKPFPVNARIDGVGEPINSSPKLELVYGEIISVDYDNLSNMRAAILPIDLTGKDVYFYVTNREINKDIVYEFKKTGKDLKAGVCYNITLDLSQATRKIEISNHELSRPEHFRALAYHAYVDEMYKVTNNIDFDGEDYFPIRARMNRKLRIDGQGYTLSNLTINWPYDGAGLIANGVSSLSNLTLENVSVTGVNYVGAFHGGMDHGTALTNCKLTGTNRITGTGDNIGGMVGASIASSLNSNIVLSNCTVEAETTVEGQNLVGGIAGSLDKASNCVSEAVVTGVSHVGGIVGNAKGKISGCGSLSEVTGTGDYVGGVIGGSNSYSSIVGAVSGSAEYCYSTGTVTGNDYVGGIIGSGEDNAINLCYSTGTISGNSYVGGISGSKCEITNCYSLGEVTGKSITGGISGEIMSIKNCYYAGTVSSDYGIAGYRTFTNRTYQNCITTAASLSPFETDEEKKQYANLQSIQDNLDYINGDKFYSTTRVWPDVEHECPIFLWQITDEEDGGSSVEVPPFTEEDW